MQTTIQKIEAMPGQRILALSDVHGHLECLRKLLQKVGYSQNDVLVIAGDLVDKGPDSLQTVRYVMELERQKQVYISAGNVDISRCRLLCDTAEGSAQRFLDFVRWQERHWGCGLLLDMLAELEIRTDCLTPENAREYQALLRERFQAEIAFLMSRPTILDMGSTIFVHGGIPTDDLDSLSGTAAFPWLKNDCFLEKGNSFSRCVVVGHWPVSLYVHDREWLKPIFDFQRKIISMDGGCGVQEAGQLNVLIFPDRDAAMQEIGWDFYDGNPKIIAAEAQEEAPFSLYLQYFDSQVELLEEQKELALCRHQNTGKQLWIPQRFLYTEDDGTWHADNFSDARLAVKPGDIISVVCQGSYGCYGKLDGILGWYHGSWERGPED